MIQKKAGTSFVKGIKKLLDLSEYLNPQFELRQQHYLLKYNQDKTIQHWSQ